ncbi:O-antigen ligase family protein [Rhizobium sp. AG855]|uniref:O-antigen ligase family protein n=1 Tax=Rhizobium sp. AG855 TaxID=2183898 RepID=UPI000E743CDB|nr:O-antigen ligase family protein [Rhizobium sp. AG855]RKE85772.1 O-antigen ligase [Rhizobium sp. AG855]
MQLQRSDLTRNTTWALFAILSLSSLHKAVMDFSFMGTAGLALIYLLIGVLKPRLDGAIGLFVALSGLYFAVQLIYFLMHFGTYFPKPDDEWSQPLKHINFLLPFFVAARLATVPRESLLRTMWIAAAVWGLVSLPIALYQGLILNMRVEGGAGNAIPFAAMSALFSSFALLGFNNPDRRYRWLAAAGFCAGFLCVLFSQTKSIIPVPLFGLGLYWLIFLRGRMKVRHVCLAVVGVLLFMGVGLYVSDSWQRFSDIWAIAVEGDETAQLGGSYTERLIMWSQGLNGILEMPWSGHGFQNRRHFIDLLGYDYNHWHNGFITAAFDNGIPGLVALVLLLFCPVWIAWRCPRDKLFSPRLFMATILVFVYVWGGAVNQIFGHVIYNALFLWVGLVIAVSAAPKASDDVQGSA